MLSLSAFSFNAEYIAPLVTLLVPPSIILSVVGTLVTFPRPTSDLDTVTLADNA